MVETEEQIYSRIKSRFQCARDLTSLLQTGGATSLIVSGPPGLGKSYTIINQLESSDSSGSSYEVVKGFCRATGLYKQLYSNRFPGRVLVLDDCDSVFGCEVSLNMLKAALDSGQKRVVSYLAEFNLQDEETGERLPRSFDFEGSVIFITNIDFDRLINSKSKYGPHLEALMSRSHYLDLAIKTPKDYLIRIKQVIQEGLLSDLGLTPEGQRKVFQFIVHNYSKLRELSIRMVTKLGQLEKSMPEKWESIAEITLFRN